VIIECSNCQTRFQLDDSRVPLRGIRVRCSRCKEAFFLEHPKASQAEAAHDVAEHAAGSVGPDTTQDLSSEDRLLLKMRFDEGLSVPEIAMVVNLKPKTIYARITRLLKRIRCRLEQSGVRWETLQSLVGRSELALDLGTVFPDVSNRTPLSV